MGLENFKNTTEKFIGEYCDNEKLDAKINELIKAIKSENFEGVSELNGKKMIKTEKTLMLKANSNEGTPKRYQPGEQLVTYKSEFDENGNPVQETWGGGVANIEENSVILSNGPIHYPEGHKYSGQVVKGFYDENAYFTVDQENGNEELNNEYVSDTEFVKDSYGIDATDEWESGLKLLPSYLLEVTEDTGEAIIGKNKIKVDVGGYIAIDFKNGEVTSVRGISKTDLDNTYTDYDEYLNSIDSKSN